MSDNERADTVCSTGEFDEDEPPFVEQLKRRKKRTKPLNFPPPTKKTLTDNLDPHPGKCRTPEVKTLLSAFLLYQQTPLVYNTSNIPRPLRKPNLCYNKKNSHRNTNRNNYQSNHCGDHNARTKILTGILSCFHNRNHAQGCHINSNSNISKPSLILSNREQPVQQLRSGLQHAQQHKARPQQQLPQLRVQQHRPQSDPQTLPSNMIMSPTGLITQLIALKAAQLFSSGDPCPTPLTPLTPFRQHRYFIVIHGSSQSPYFPIKAGVSQGSILSPLLYPVYTSDIPEHPAILLASFADDTAILSTNSDPTLTSINPQSYLTTLQTWCSNWKIRENPQKCVHVTFTLRHSFCPPVYRHRAQLPPVKVVRYLGLYIDRTLTWSPTHD
ncbi:hypothetical protein AAG570_006950 [Ranatra chinensis]|uniref:Reverse transcriptase domain-containing protein n=1 Tax=Ranatra chinensis TaxID=642074 RepID=A0ABD0ZGQ4_9HEMI